MTLEGAFEPLEDPNDVCLWNRDRGPAPHRSGVGRSDCPRSRAHRRVRRRAHRRRHSRRTPRAHSRPDALVHRFALRNTRFFFPPPPRPSFESLRTARTLDGRATNAMRRCDRATHLRPPPARPAESRAMCNAIWPAPNQIRCRRVKVSAAVAATMLRVLDLQIQRPPCRKIPQVVQDSSHGPIPICSIPALRTLLTRKVSGDDRGSRFGQILDAPNPFR